MAKYKVEFLNQDTKQVETKEIEASDVKRTGKDGEWTDFLNAHNRVVESMRSAYVRSIQAIGPPDKEGPFVA